MPGKIQEPSSDLTTKPPPLSPWGENIQLQDSPRYQSVRYQSFDFPTKSSLGDQKLHLTGISASLTGSRADHPVRDGVLTVRSPALLLADHVHVDAPEQVAGRSPVAGVTPASH